MPRVAAASEAGQGDDPSPDLVLERLSSRATARRPPTSFLAAT